MVIIIILAKLIEDTSANGSIPNALKKLNIAKQAITALNKCKFIFDVFKDARVINIIIKTGNRPKDFARKVIQQLGLQGKEISIALNEIEEMVSTGQVASYDEALEVLKTNKKL